MKRHGNLLEKCTTLESLFDAYQRARRGKRKKRACLNFEKNLGLNLKKLQEELTSETYHPQEYYSFEVREKKPRTIFAPAFRDVVVQHAVYKELYPIFNQTFIDQSFACRLGKGTHRCADYIQRTLSASNPKEFTVHLDVRKFFYRIDRDILFELISKKIKDLKLLKIIKNFIDFSEPLGIPIGNLLSQLFALVYLNSIDHFIKRELKIKWYCRYVDDLIFIGVSLEKAHEVEKEVTRFLKDNLHLSLSKANISPVSKGLNAIGYRTWPKFRLIRKLSLEVFGKNVRKLKFLSLISCLAHSKKTASFPFQCNILGSLPATKNHKVLRKMCKTKYGKTF